MYYIVDKNTRAVVRTSLTPFNIDGNLQPPSPYVQLRRVDDNAVPAYDAATQKIVRIFTDSDAAGTRTYSNSVVPLTQAELDAKAQATTDAQQLQLIKDAYNDLRNGTGTAGERLVRVERALAWLLRQHVRNS